MNQKVKTLAVVKAFGIKLATADEIIAIANRYEASGNVLLERDKEVAELLRKELLEATTIDITAEEWLNAFIKLTK